MALNSKEIEALIELAKQGKQAAFKKLLDEFWPYIYGFQVKRTENEYLAEDISIRTFEKAFDRLETYKPNYSFKTWLVVISKNIHVDTLRKEKTSITTKTIKASEDTLNKVVDGNPSAEDELINKQNLALLLNIVKKMRPHYQEVINLRYFQEMNYKDMAETINEPITTIKVRLLRAKKLLSDLILKHNTGLSL